MSVEPESVARVDVVSVLKERNLLRDALKKIAALPDVHFDFVLGRRGEAEERGGKMNDPATCPGCIAEKALNDLRPTR